MVVHYCAEDSARDSLVASATVSIADSRRPTTFTLQPFGKSNIHEDTTVNVRFIDAAGLSNPTREVITGGP